MAVSKSAFRARTTQFIHSIYDHVFLWYTYWPDIYSSHLNSLQHFGNVDVNKKCSIWIELYFSLYHLEAIAKHQSKLLNYCYSSPSGPIYTSTDLQYGGRERERVETGKRSERNKTKMQDKPKPNPLKAEKKTDYSSERKGGIKHWCDVTWYDGSSPACAPSFSWPKAGHCLLNKTYSNNDRQGTAVTHTHLQLYVQT